MAESQSEDTWGLLVSRIASGDREAEKMFVQQFQRSIRALVRRHSRPGDPAVDDVVQDVLFHVIERLRVAALKDANALPGYIRMAVVNATTAEYRRRKLRGESASAADMDDLVMQLDDPADVLDSAQLAIRIRDLVEELPVRRDREILVRFYLQDEDKVHICEALGIDVSHFHRVIHRARERFRVLAVADGIKSARQGETNGFQGAPVGQRAAQRLGTGTHE